MKYHSYQRGKECLSTQEKYDPQSTIAMTPYPYDLNKTQFLWPEDHAEEMPSDEEFDKMYAEGLALLKADGVWEEIQAETELPSNKRFRASFHTHSIDTNSIV